MEKLDILDLCGDLKRALETSQLLNEELYDTQLRNYDQMQFARDASMKEAMNILQQITEALKAL